MKLINIFIFWQNKIYDVLTIQFQPVWLNNKSKSIDIFFTIRLKIVKMDDYMISR